jgi:hypothetical protein
MNKCCYCDKIAAYRIGGSESELLLCLDCRLKLEHANALEFQRTVQQLNFVAAAFEATSGLPGLVPRIPTPQVPPLQVGSMNVNNFNVDNSVVGVLNAGSIQSVNNAITVLRQHGSDNVANAIADFTQRLVDSTEVDNDTKNRVVEILSAVAEEVAKPETERRRGVIRPLLNEVSTAVSGLADLTQLWREYGVIILSYFN